MSFDKSSPERPGSKWRRVTEAERHRQMVVASHIRTETAAMNAGLPIAPALRRREPVPDYTLPLPETESEDLMAFLGEHGRDIAHLTVQALTWEAEWKLARAYRALVRGEPRANEAWHLVLQELNLM